MTDRNQAQAAANGCLSRVFILIGIVWVGALLVGTATTAQSGGSFEFIGGFVPALAFFSAGAVMRRRAREAQQRQDTFKAPTTPQSTHRATTTKTASTEVEAKPSSKRSEVSSSPTSDAGRRKRPVPELPPIEPAPEGMTAVEDLDISDFSPGRPLTSEERIQQAREKYLRKRP